MFLMFDAFNDTETTWQALDSESTDTKIVLNRIVPLKEDSGKNQ